MWPWTVLSFLLVLLAMEPYSAWVHRVLWHGPLWSMHRSHHRERVGAKGGGGLVANDLLSASHVPISMALIAWGFFGEGLVAALVLGAGLAMGAFGLLYVVFHDGMVHGRLPVRALARWPVLAAIVAAHERHHRSNGAPYGFFASPFVEGGAARGGGAEPMQRPRPAAARRLSG